MVSNGKGSGRLRLAFYVSRFPVLSETFVLGQITGMIDRGHEVTIFARRPESEGKVHPDVERYGLIERTRYWPEPGDERAVALRAARRHPVRALEVAWRCRDEPSPTAARRRALMPLAEGEFDAILCHFGNNAVDAQHLRDLGGLRGKLVAIFHAWELTLLLRERGERYYDDLFDKADLLLPISEHWRRRLLQLGCPPRKLDVHHMGVDTTKLSFRERHKEDGAPVELLSVARLVEKKGLGDAIAAVAALREAGVDFRYRIVGDGPLKEELEREVAEHGLDDHVQLLGAKTQDVVHRMIDEAHLLLAPSVTASNGDQEGIPVSIMEAMARGLVVVSTHHTGIPELVEDGESGVLVDEHDVEALGTALVALATEPERWASLGRAARQRVEDAFDQDKLNDALVERVRGL
jgi:colanic acid/amylovoran biosynthesis glycosyltransferase